VVDSIIYDENKGKAIGVRVVDAESKQSLEYYAKVIFVNAGTLNTTLILLYSISSRFPNGLGNDSGVLGHYLMAHNYRGRLSAEFEGFKDKYHFGRRPTGTYIPRFRNYGSDKQEAFLRGYAYSLGASRNTGDASDGEQRFGAQFKARLTEPGPWRLGMTGMGECLPYHDNEVRLSKNQKDEWGMPLLEVSCEYKVNELNMLNDILDSGAEMLEKAGFKNIVKKDSGQAPGLDIHEMGTARMGSDPKTSILNKFNQMHAVPNVFVSDGACMTSSACQNPSITYMALTARAANFAIDEVKKMNI
jgi:choline dehydrogenase-like flavoprotein